MKNKIIVWLEPFYYPRATYDTHLRVKVGWWLLFGAQAITYGFFGFLFTIGAMAKLLSGARTLTEVIGMTAAWMVRYVPGATLTTTLIAIFFFAVGLGWLLYMLTSRTTAKPAPITEYELAELRQLGYIVCEVNKNGNCPHCHNCGCGLFGNPESGQLDSVGVVDSGATAPAKSD